MLSDLAAGGGLRLNSRPITQAALNDGDQISIGSYVLTFHTRAKAAGFSPSIMQKEARVTAPPEVRGAWLVNAQGGRIAMPTNGALRIGREPDNSLMLDDDTVSRHHAVITAENQSFQVRVLGSSNGTFVNGRRVSNGAVFLQPGDSVRFGNVSFQFQAESIQPPTRYCTKCGAEVSRGSRICQRCAAAVTTSSSPDRADFGTAPVRGYGSGYAQAEGLTSERFGGFWIRTGAWLVDGAILSPIGLIVGLISGAIGGVIAAIVTAGGATPAEYGIVGGVLGFIAAILVNWIYFASLESSALQGTFGKWLFGLRVANQRGNRISWREANVRYWGKIVSGLILGVGFIMAGWTAEKTALHDDIAATRAMRLR